MALDFTTIEEETSKDWDFFGSKNLRKKFRVGAGVQLRVFEKCFGWCLS